jgi:thiamine-monophosphate kinase
MTQVIGELGEKTLLREILIPLVNPTDDPSLAGDDSGMFDISDGYSICASTDRVPWDLTAFRTGVMSEYDLGYYLAALNVSDIAAMGATPRGLLLNFALPATFPVDSLTAIVRGVLAGAEEFGASVLGGDLSDAPEPSLCATSLGTVRRTRCLRRRGATVGDRIYVTGPFGIGAAALRYFFDGPPPGRSLAASDESALRQAFRRPVPRLSTGQLLARSGARVTAMDNTDGIGQSLFELASINSAGYVVDRDDVPLHPLVIAVADLFGDDPFDLAMGPGADFNLVGTIDDVRIARNAGLHVIGVVCDGHGLSVSSASATRTFTPHGWNYFQRVRP